MKELIELPSEEGKEIDKIIEHLTHEFAIHSHGTAFLVMKLIDGYKQLESKLKESQEQIKHLVETMHEQAYYFQTEIDKLKKSDQEALANAWEEAIREFILINLLDMNYYERPKNPYTKE